MFNGRKGVNTTALASTVKLSMQRPQFFTIQGNTVNFEMHTQLYPATVVKSCQNYFNLRQPGILKIQPAHFKHISAWKKFAGL